jgi:hypothetical protein
MLFNGLIFAIALPVRLPAGSTDGSLVNIATNNARQAFLLFLVGSKVVLF